MAEWNWLEWRVLVSVDRKFVYIMGNWEWKLMDYDKCREAGVEMSWLKCA